jgi:hypothetical protein
MELVLLAPGGRVTVEADLDLDRDVAKEDDLHALRRGTPAQRLRVPVAQRAQRAERNDLVAQQGAGEGLETRVVGQYAYPVACQMT